MSAPKLEVFFLYNMSTGAPLTGQTGLLSFTCYKDDLGVNLAQPSFTEIGGGAYSFPVTFADPARGVVYVVDTGSNASPAHVARYGRGTDWNEDNADVLSSAIQTIVTAIAADVNFMRDYAEGKWEIKTVGPDANRMIFYAADGTTIIQKYDLRDASNLPTTINPFARLPLLPVGA